MILTKRKFRTACVVLSQDDILCVGKWSSCDYVTM